VKEITILIDDRTHDLLAAVAHGRGETVVQMLATLSYRLARTATAEHEILALHSVGMCDADIARTLGLTNHQVAARRQAASLPAHPRKRKAPSGK
jgi:hypothetical protein